MENAISLKDALEAAIRYRVVRTADGVCAEPGDSSDNLFDAQQILGFVHVALERGDEVEIFVEEVPRAG